VDEREEGICQTDGLNGEDAKSTVGYSSKGVSCAVRGALGRLAMGVHRSIVDSSSPAEIAKAIVKVNKTFGLHRTGMNVLWKLYYVPDHTVTRAELEEEFGLLEDHFDLFSRRVAEELGATELDALALMNSSEEEPGFEKITLKPSVVLAIQSYAFSK
jgi:hypothetical protein